MRRKFTESELRRKRMVCDGGGDPQVIDD
ncbi:unnamed protein product [Lathyrus oleraceus]